MSELEALLLGIVQGLTEFLPISSSGHLILVPWLQDYTFLQQHEQFNKTFDVALHIGTLVAVLAYFHRELTAAALGFVRTLRKRAITDQDEMLAWVIVVGTIPAVIVGGLGEDWIDTHLGEPWMIGIQLIAFGLLLAHADRRPQRREAGDVRLRDGAIIGVAQALALAPGTSRSASPSCSSSRRPPAPASSRPMTPSPRGSPTASSARWSSASSPPPYPAISRSPV
jgi:undecaprenyl-diphosphatase